MPSAFETEQMVVRDLFSDRFVFEFPDFQRPYRWTIDNADDLLKDLVRAAETGADQSVSVGGYFIGSIVLVRRTDRLVQVIDGRQRLTTLAILIAVLRDLERDAARKRDLHTMLYDQGSDVLQIKAGYRLAMGDFDGPAFQKLVAEPGATAQLEKVEDDDLPERHSRFLEVAQLFRGQLMRWAEDKRLKLLNYVLLRCESIVITAPSEHLGERIFRVLNARGLPLSQADLVRPIVLASVGPDVRHVASEAWERTDALLGMEGMTALLRAVYFILERRTLPLEFDDEFGAFIRRRGGEAFVLDLLPRYGEALSQIYDGSLPYTREAFDPNKLLMGLEWLGWPQLDWIPCVLEMVCHYRDEALLFRYLKLVDRYCYIAMTLNYEEHERQTIFAKVIADIRDEKDPARETGPLWVTNATAERFRDRLMGPIERPFQQRALMRRVEAIKDGANLHPQIGVATVEHILPRRVPKNSDWHRTFSKSEAHVCRELLGNLVLLIQSKNARVANEGFDKKKQIIFKHSTHRQFEVTAEIRTHAEWTPEVVRIRTKELVSLLLTFWELGR